jgi:transposase
LGWPLGGQAGARLAGKLGMTASGSTLLRLLHHLETPAIEEPRVIGIDEWAFRKKAKVEVPYPRELAWILLRPRDELNEAEQHLLKLLWQDTKLAEFRQLALQFRHIVRNGLSQQWASWLESSCASAVKELKHFAIGLKKDGAAVYEAIQQPWNNGPTEGHVNKLKFLKRQMYGRASFDLLRLRVLLVD